MRWVLLLALIIISTRRVRADSPPPGYMTFRLYFHVESISIGGNELFLYEDPSCSNYTPYDGDFSCVTVNALYMLMTYWIASN